MSWKIYNIIYKVVNSLRQLFVRGCVTPDGQKNILLNVFDTFLNLRNNTPDSETWKYLTGNYVDAISLSHIVSGKGGTPFAICIVNILFSKFIAMLTKKDLIRHIVKHEYHDMGKKTTVCLLTLDNGFEVVGTSSCIDPKNYDQRTGAAIAYENAVEKLWELYWFLEHEKKDEPVTSTYTLGGIADSYPRTGDCYPTIDGSSRAMFNEDNWGLNYCNNK